MEKNKTLWERLTQDERREVRKKYREFRGQFVAHRNGYVRAIANGKMQVLEELFDINNIG